MLILYGMREQHPAKLDAAVRGPVLRGAGATRPCRGL